MDWYDLFLAAVFLIWLGATDADRSALRIVLVATVTSFIVANYITAPFTGAWKLVVPAALETATVLALLRWAPTRTGWRQVWCVVCAWFAHALCFADLQLGTDVVYSRYEAVLGIVALAQLAFCHDTITHYFLQLGHWWRAIHNPRVVRASSAASVVLHHPGVSRLQPIPPCPEICPKR